MSVTAQEVSTLHHYSIDGGNSEKGAPVSDFKKEK